MRFRHVSILCLILSTLCSSPGLRAQRRVVVAPAHTPPAPRTMAASAKFLGRDAKTEGDWVGVYGRHGFLLPANLGRVAFSYPGILLRRGTGDERPRTSPFQEAQEEQHSLVRVAKGNKPADSRLPLLGPGVGRRTPVLFSAEGGIPLAFRADISDGKPRRLSIYLLDFARKGRSISLALTETSGRVLDRRKITGFGGGIYARYIIRGSVLISITPLDGSEATCGGIFVDPN